MNKHNKYMLALGVVAAMGFAACDEDDVFDVNSPEWLTQRVDSIANSKLQAASGDTTWIEVAKTEVGTEDCSIGWWADFSDVFAVPVGKKLDISFTNYTSGANNWNNWNLCVANAKATSTEADANYKEYFVIRSDAYGWSGGMNDLYPYDAGNISTNYAEVATAAGAEDMWAYFLQSMQGAKVNIELQHVSPGYLYMTATATNASGDKFVEKYFQTCDPVADIFAFLVPDGSYLKDIKACLTPATIVLSDSKPVSLEVSGYPSIIALGDTVFNAGVTGKVTFADGTSAELEAEDMFYTVPNLSVPGKVTIGVGYNKTSRGNFCEPVLTSYPLQIAAAFVSVDIKLTEGYVYAFYGEETELPIDPASYKVIGVDANGDETDLTASATLVKSVVGKDGKISVEYEGKTIEATADVKTITAEAVTLGDVALGAEDNSSAWWTVFSDKTKVPAYTAKTFEVTVNSSAALQNWHNVSLIMTNEAGAEYGVLRMDNHGWGTAVEGKYVPESDWVWETFAANIAGSKYTMTFVNRGATADVFIDVVDGSGAKHFQNYKNIRLADVERADIDDVFVHFTLEMAQITIK